MSLKFASSTLPAHRRLRLSGLLVAGLLAGLVTPIAAGSPAGATAIPGSCADPVLSRSMPLAAAMKGTGISRSTRAQTLAEARDTMREPLSELAEDPTLWLDRCADPFYRDVAVEPAPSARAQARAVVSAELPAALSDTFTLNSRPGAAKTIYLDFLGETVTGTAWNGSYGSTITATPFSLTAPADTNFTDAELAAVQTAWASVAEDFAPFDVNVTTQDPGDAALLRSSVGDQQYGVRMVVTNGGPIASSCRCGGVAYVGVFDEVSPVGSHNVGWVFADKTGLTAKGVAEAAAHEAGHTFGLHHDGQGSADYYFGATRWAPIMGAGYNQPVTQWSKGEYTGATNTEDDLAIIASKVPLLEDDHGDTADAATTLTLAHPQAGLITSGSDVDAFTLAATGDVTVTVASPSSAPDLDAELRVLDATGDLMAVVDPTATATGTTTASGLSATWTGTVEEQQSPLTLLVAGAGVGNPTDAGGYSSYGSLGAYEVLASTGTEGALALAGVDLPDAAVGTAYTATPTTATGGTGGYHYSATGLPTGLTLSVATGLLSGTPQTAGRSDVTITVEDSSGATTSATGSLLVAGTASSAPLAADGVTVYTPYDRPVDVQLNATGGSGSYTFAPKPSRSWPAWLSVSSDGRVSGTPTTSRSASVSVVVDDGASSVTVPVRIYPSVPPVAAIGQTLALSTSPLTFEAKTAVSQQLTATGGTGSYAFTARGLPSGLRLSKTGLLTGKPSKGGSYVATIRVTSGAEVVAETLAFTVTWPTMVVASPTVKAVATRKFSSRFKAAGGTGKYLWSSSELPAGLKLSTSGTLSGVYPEATTVSFTATVSSGRYLATVPVTIAVVPSPLKLAGSVNTRAGVVGAPYAVSLTITGGTAPYDWELVGSIPAGLSAHGQDTATLTVDGTLAAPVSSYLTVTVYDANGQKLTRKVRLWAK